MMSHYTKLFTLLLVVAFFGGCSTENPDAVYGGHPEGWVSTHRTAAQTDLDSCTSCHGADYNGSGNIPGCSSCHLGTAPTFSVHPDSWITVSTDHWTFAEATSWTSCAITACHGPDLQTGTTGPSCFLAACHVTGPPKPHGLYDDPNLHGTAAKGVYDALQSMIYCQNCHGRPTNNFDGGMVSDPAILNLAGGNCASTSCHPAARAHPTNWQGTNDIADPFTHSSTHRTVNNTIIDSACSLCHNTVSTGTGALTGAPSCYSASFQNSDGGTTGCHPTGPGNAPHVVPFTDPNLHGTAAKADLTYCQQCHAESGGAGSNPRFNVAVGNLVNGCEDCHIAGAAHPPAVPVGTPGIPSVDRWTFRGDLTSTRRTHFAAGNVMTACTLCHGANLNGTGGTGPSCLTCHADTVQFALNCNACHGTPPSAATNVPGATPVNHTTVTDQAGFNSAHDECTTCHGAKDVGTGSLSVVGTEYQLFDRTVALLNQGGDHLDGNIEMNGPTPATGAGYNEGSFSCDNACHSELSPYVLSDSSLPVEYGNYGNSPGAGCTFCHGYPPDGTPDLTGATPVDHTAVTNPVSFLTAHNDCSTCHGVKDDGTGTHLPTGNYSVANDHQDGNINLNSDTQYNINNFGCDLSCHGNPDPPPIDYRLTDSGLNVVLDSYGSGGGGGACDSCHTSGLGGTVPIVIAGTSSHTGSWTCEECHTGHGAGTVIIPNNATVGINYPNDTEHQGGISLGGSVATGATEAEICWNCHDTIGSVSEWGQNQKTNTGSSNYNYGQIYTTAGTTTPTSNWVGAWWKSGQTEFGYKTGQIQSTHSVNSAVLTAGVDAEIDIRCSYCHDVHDLNRATDDTMTGKPYLRGSWMGNPYQEDGAPQLNTTYLNLQRFGRVPRGNISQTVMGGYWIDQNSGNPTSGWTLASSAGLCTLCHGTNVNTLNQFGTAANAWVGSNGHSNAVIGGTGSLAANIFDLRGGNTSNSTNPAMAFQGANRPGDERSLGFRNENNPPDIGSAGWQPALNPTGEVRSYQNYEWAATVNASTIDPLYHKFSCSKCHNPHASRLPRLMITNCLDTKHNSWDNNYQLASAPQAGSNNIDRSISNWTSAQNCHRLGGNDPSDGRDTAGTGSGWNRVTPWTTEGTQDNLGIE
jgi:hypothetical protein